MENKTLRFNAIIYTEQKQVSGSQFLKYRNIKNTERSLQKFIEFAKGFPGAVHVNLYDSKTKKFIEQRTLL